MEDQKLTLKELAPYLPYELKGISNSGSIFYLGIRSNMLAEGIETREIITFINEGFKPILRPMSDFKNHEGPTIWAMEIDRKYNYNVYMSSGYSHVKLDRYPYVVFNCLIENHFDVFGLIEKGLSVDVNTL